jgi:HrpA-like RNA helicase
MMDSSHRLRSHVVLDEVHERDILTDFLLIVLRDVLPVRPNLKVWEGKRQV